MDHIYGSHTVFQMTGLTEMTPAQKSLFAALALALPTPENLIKPVL